MIHGGSRPDLAATIMTEDAKTEENTAGGPCGAYIETPCKFAACRAYNYFIPCEERSAAIVSADSCIPLLIHSSIQP